jgi:hypothetical protein
MPASRAVRTMVPIQFHVLREIGEDRTIVIAIGRRDKTPPLLWIQRMLAHEPADLLGVYDNATIP